jgi:hypothetical protein
MNGEALNLPESWPEKLVLPIEDCRSLLRLDRHLMIAC